MGLAEKREVRAERLRHSKEMLSGSWAASVALSDR